MLVSQIIVQLSLIYNKQILNIIFFFENVKNCPFYLKCDLTWWRHGNKNQKALQNHKVHTIYWVQISRKEINYTWFGYTDVLWLLKENAFQIVHDIRTITILYISEWVALCIKYVDGQQNGNIAKLCNFTICYRYYIGRGSRTYMMDQSWFLVKSCIHLKTEPQQYVSKVISV